ncbi:hypothetical protein [Frigoriglobus tundricola]|uniref:Glycosyltransferase RgtA/B/C/D-like domain-containing protein n=1 Tax=Frigoriglobus tundricola TaxID=2774151 RepID=A0A6M5Z279_9BACT|nr:hypothetical protein [Frigoriglobus tundricola]QJW99282.1 hypothetical protein FTUN_6884 [Frigoriglobus tundricola]
MIGPLIALVLPAVSGSLACRLLWPAAPRSYPAAVLHASLGTGFGLGAASCVYFAALLVGGSPGASYPWVEGAGFVLVSAGLGVALRRRGGANLDPPAAGAADGFQLIWVVAAVALACFLIGYPIYYSMVPHGINDSVMFWNLRARFLFRGEDRWRDGFGDMYIAPDYPLLLPSVVARCWTYQGHESTLAPALVALTFGLACVATLVAGLALLRGPTQGFLAGLVLLGTSYYFETTAMQVCDVPVAFFYLASAVALCCADRCGASRTLPVLAGAMAGFAAWTKNDGQLFFVALLAVRAGQAVATGTVRRFAHEFGGLLAGAAPALLALLVFKYGVAPTSDFVTGQGEAVTLGRLQDPERYLLIVQTFVGDLLGIGPGLIPVLALYAILVGSAPPARRQNVKQFFVLTILMLIGYAAVYLITPHDLRWRLETSFDRLRMQLWPLALFAFFLWVAAPAEAVTRADPVPRPEPPVGPRPSATDPAGGSPSMMPRYRGGRE